MKAYFYVFLSFSLAIFLLVMQQIRSAIAETDRESQAWLVIDVSAAHQKGMSVKMK